MKAKDFIESESKVKIQQAIDSCIGLYLPSRQGGYGVQLGEITMKLRNAGLEDFDLEFNRTNGHVLIVTGDNSKGAYVASIGFRK